MRQQYRPLIALALICWASVPTYGQRKRSIGPPAQKPSSDAEYMPKGFVGDNISLTYKQMFSQMKPKDEYESSGQYSARLAEGIKKYQDHVFFFLFKPPLMPGINDDFAVYRTNYDADSQQLAIDIPSKGSLGEELEVTLDGSVTTSRHRASNRFGASTIITRYTGNLYGIVFDWKSRNIRVPVKVSPAEAKTLRNRIAIVFIGAPKMKSGFGSMVKTYEPMPAGASMTNPYEDIVWSHHICVDVKSVWVYDRVTMKVLARLNREL